jgi:hypothetical protein
MTGVRHGLPRSRDGQLPLRAADRGQPALRRHQRLFTTRHGFLELDAPLLALCTTAVETALRSRSKYLQANELAGQLRAALTSRAVIDQAKGVLMAVHGMTADQAFQLLVEQSQRENVKLRMLAERFITDVVSRSSGSSAGCEQSA